MAWKYENLLKLELEYREKARLLVQSRLPNYTAAHCTKLLGGSPYEFSSRCVLSHDELIGVMAFTVGKLETVEIVAFVSFQDKKGIGRFLMESFVSEMTIQGKKSAILTYIEPSAFDFFSRFGFSKTVPARSLYERITSKYVGALFMYKELLITLPKGDRDRSVSVGDRLLIVVDGTLIPRQAIVKEIDSESGKVYVHYFFWNNRHDEWIHLHSPRVRWDLPLPPEAPKHAGENCLTRTQVEELLSAELKKEKKSELVESNGSWPRSIKRNVMVQVKIEGNWIIARVLQKTDLYLFCEFEYNGTTWQQDFPRESVRLGDDHPTVLEDLLKRSIKRKSSVGFLKEGIKTSKKRKAASSIHIELTPPKHKATKRIKRPASDPPMSEETIASTEDGHTTNSIILG